MKLIKLKYDRILSENDSTLYSVSSELKIINKSSLTFAYKVIETGDKQSLVRFENLTSKPATLYLFLEVEKLNRRNGLIERLNDSRLNKINYYVSVYCQFRTENSDEPLQIYSTQRYGFSIFELEDRNFPAARQRYLNYPLFGSKTLPVNAEFLIDYEDTLLPLKEECPVGTSKLLTHNYPGYICVDYEPIEKSIKDIKKIVKGM